MRRTTRSWRAPIAAISLAFCAPAKAQPAGVQITPVIVEVSADRGFGAVRVRNWREREVSFEADVFAWTQHDGADVLEHAQDVIVAPSVFAVPAGGEQIVRLAIAPADAARERAYRLLLREIIHPSPADAALRVQLQFSLPVFSASDGASANVEVRALRSADGFAVEIANTGARHARLLELFVGEQALAAPRYLLAGARFVRPAPQSARTLALTYRGGEDAAAHTMRLALAAPPPSPDLP